MPWNSTETSSRGSRKTSQASSGHAYFGEAGHVGIEHAAEAEAAIGLCNDDAIDVEEFADSARGTRESSGSRSCASSRSAMQESGDMAVGFGDAEVGGFIGKSAQRRGVEGQDGAPAALFRASTESSSCSRTSRMAMAMRSSLRCWFGAMRLLTAELSHAPLRGACRSEGIFR